MSSIGDARALLARVRAAGVREFCVCAGSRNSPLLYALSDTPLFSFIDERSASFFAIGRIKLHGSPVAVVTTSGTAAAELLPACVEAYYAGLPLVLITADRPARYRGTGAPQSIEQVGLFGVYAGTDIDAWSRRGPLHCNIEFDEPLLESAPHPRFADPLPASRGEGSRGRRPDEGLVFRRPLVILGGLDRSDRPRVRAFVERLNAPVYAEALSGLRGATANQITAGERMISRGDFDGVIRIGNVPTLRFWRDLDESRKELPAVSYSRLPFAGLSRGEVRSIDDLPDPRPVDAGGFLQRDRDYAARFAQILDDEPHSELAMLRDLSRKIPEDARVYLGNSLPIREWDLVAERKLFECEGNRGANGIDGQLSTFFGWCKKGADNWCIVGDLTALYDANAPWIVPQLDAGFTICIINNGGGRIFSRVASLKRMDEGYRRRVIENEHAIRFETWSEMWNIADRVIELRPDAEASERVWKKYDALWA